ncbi:hypothetical protein LguiB_004968 [Lonicera macranthoides]
MVFSGTIYSSKSATFELTGQQLTRVLLPRFLSLPALIISAHMFLAIPTPLSFISCILLPEPYIYPLPLLNCITKPSLLNSSLIQLTDFISMENLTLPPTTVTTNITTTLYNHQEQTSTNTTLYNQEETLTLGNQERPNMINEAYSYVPSFAMHHSKFHNTSPYLQSNNQNMQFPYSHLYRRAVPVVFPGYPYQVEGSGTVKETPNSFPDRLLSNGNVGHTVQRTISIPPAGLSEFQKPRRSKPSITNSSRSKTKQKMGKRAASSYGSNGDQDLYTISTPDNRKLRVLLQKDLSSSDVGTVGRIVLPKREAERNLPSLSDKEGIQLVMRDVCSTRQWQMRYRFWSNHKGRMYLLDQIGDFVGQNGLEIGDCLTIYEDESKNLYFSIRKAEKPAQQPLNEPRNACYSYGSIPFTEGATDEDTLSLQILTEELKHTDQENNSLTTLIQTLLHQPNNQQ